MDRIGRKQTMTLGFFLWYVAPPSDGLADLYRSALGFIIGGALKPIQSVFPLFVVLYGIFQALGEMGPGVSIFLPLLRQISDDLRSLHSSVGQNHSLHR